MFPLTCIGKHLCIEFTRVTLTVLHLLCHLCVEMEAGLVNFTYGVNSGSWSTWTIGQESRIYVKCIGDVELNEQYNILCVEMHVIQYGHDRLIKCPRIVNSFLVLLQE